MSCLRQGTQSLETESRRVLRRDEARYQACTRTTLRRRVRKALHTTKSLKTVWMALTAAIDRRYRLRTTAALMYHCNLAAALLRILLRITLVSVRAISHRLSRCLASR
mmetsp:Transcript_20217/g.44961  ORF Transcript_20217/g.44961 Transcript_20217/m.44961 type:complete len:108 (+) Transcript_20217:1602-1925(+)